MSLTPAALKPESNYSYCVQCVKLPGTKSVYFNLQVLKWLITVGFHLC